MRDSSGLAGDLIGRPYGLRLFWQVRQAAQIRVLTSLVGDLVGRSYGWDWRRQFGGRVDSRQRQPTG